MPELAALQAWMQAAILRGANDDGVRAVRDLVRGDNRLTAETRMEIYATGYRLRLLECLRLDFPVLAALMGPTAFDLLARGYCESVPSTSYTLYDFGADFAAYLDAMRPPGLAEAAVLPALARIERAKAEALRARGIEALADAAHPHQAEETAAPFLAQWLGAQAFFRPDPVRLLRVPFDFEATLAAHEAGEPPALPYDNPSLLAVGRHRYRADFHSLEPEQFAWLESLPNQNDIEKGQAPLEGGMPPAALRGFVPRALAAGLIAPLRLLAGQEAVNRDGTLDAAAIAFGERSV
jgi:Putative DNA-binding domain